MKRNPAAILPSPSRRTFRGQSLALGAAVLPTIVSARALGLEAGTQRRSVPNFAAAVELARSGKLGTLERLNASVYRPTLGNDWLAA